MVWELKTKNRYNLNSWYSNPRTNQGLKSSNLHNLLIKTILRWDLKMREMRYDKKTNTSIGITI